MATEPKNVFSNTEKSANTASSNLQTESDAELLSRQKEEARERSKRLRKKVIPILSCALVLLIGLPILLTVILQNLQKDINDTALSGDDSDYFFYEPYDGDIMAYDVYLKLDREIGYYDNMKGYGMLDVVTPAHENANLRLIYRYLQSIIAGNAEEYNSLFHQDYFKTHSAQSEFAQQMLYDMRIYLYSSEEVGNSETLYSYCLDYRIYKNNGEFRRDIGSDMIRSVFLVLREDAAGNVSIENLVPKKVINKN